MNTISAPDDVPVNAYALLHLGESIPDVPYMAIGQRIDGDAAEEIGYREYAKYGGWLIWHPGGEDYYVIDVIEPKAAVSLDALARILSLPGSATRPTAEATTATDDAAPSVANPGTEQWLIAPK